MRKLGCQSLLDDLASVAKIRGALLPPELDAKAQIALDKLPALPGAECDKACV